MIERFARRAPIVSAARPAASASGATRRCGLAEPRVLPYAIAVPGACCAAPAAAIAKAAAAIYSPSAKTNSA